MVQTGVIYHLKNRMDGASLRIVRSIHQAAKAGMHRRSRAHGARLNCNKEFTVAETVITDGSSSLPEGQYFGMSRGIAVGNIAIPASSYHFPGAHHDRSYGDFPCFQGTLSAAQGFVHP